MIWFLPIERLEERYTVFTSDTLFRALSKHFDKCITIDAKRMYSNIVDGVFLDYADTVVFKSGQIRQVAKKFASRQVKEGDIFFVEDLWFPGLEAIKYMSDLFNIPVKIVGIMHAGTWTPGDVVTRMKIWARGFEQSIFKLSDIVFLGSHCHKEDIVRDFGFNEEEASKLVVTGLAFSTEYIDRLVAGQIVERKKNRVIFPFRPHAEKGISTFNDLVEALHEEVEFVMSTYRKDFNFDSEHEAARTRDFIRKGYIKAETEVSKARLYSLMKEANIVFSAAIEETFGYAVLEAVCLGCTPVLPNRLSYKEFFDKEYLYDTFEEAIDKIRMFVSNPRPCPEAAAKHEKNVDVMADVIKEKLGK